MSNKETSRADPGWEEFDEHLGVISAASAVMFFGGVGVIEKISETDWNIYEKVVASAPPGVVALLGTFLFALVMESPRIPNPFRWWDERKDKNSPR